MKIKEMLIRIKDAADDRLRSFCGALTPEKRLAAILILGALFAVVNFYMIFRAIYDIGREEAPREIIKITPIDVPDFIGTESQEEMVHDMEEFFKQFNSEEDE
jgi:hypothetical protein